MNRTIIMSWSKQRSWIGPTAANDAMSEDLTEIEGIKDKSTSLSVSEGDKLQAYATGHELVAEEASEPDYELTFRVIEPDFDLLALLGLGSVDGEDFTVETHVVEGNWSLKTAPKNAGGKGIKAPKCKVTYTPGYSEEEGHYADLKFKVLKGAQGYWYKMFRKAGVAKPTVTAAGNTITVACATSGAAIEYSIDGGAWTAYSAAITATAANSGKLLRARATKGDAVSAVATHTIAYTA